MDYIALTNEAFIIPTGKKLVKKKVTKTQQKAIDDLKKAKTNTAKNCVVSYVFKNK